LKLLLDTWVSPRTRDALAAVGHDAIWTGDSTPDPGDEAILERAQRESRILVTLDKDFGELAVVFGRPHCGIVRLVDIDPARQAAVCEDVLTRYGAELIAGAIATVTADRTRLRPGDDGPETPKESVH
jgi:predicted nuclease of predicted toxin-antitoxin system